jgi:iron complex outermembrane receptor protein
MPRSSRFQSRTRKLLALLMVGGAIGPGVALAQEAGAEQAGDVIQVTGRRLSQTPEAIGEDQVTNTVGITREALLSAPSGISGLKMLEQLPGFNVQTEGSLGLYEFGNSVQTRAFNLDQIGFTLDGIPMGRSDAFGGSPIFRYVDNENLGVVEASPGAGDVSIPTYSSLGPVVQYRSIVPQDEMGLFVSQTFGEDNLRRTFVRASTGEVAGVKGYVSYTNLKSDLWRGAGSIDREHWEAQLLADLGGDSWARLKFVSNDFFDYDSPTLSRAEYLSATPDAGGQTGRDRGYIGVLPAYAPLPTAPNVPFSNAAYTYYYGTAINIRKDKLFGATIHTGLTDNLWAETTLYWEDKGGYGVSPDSYANSLTNYSRQIAVGLPVTPPRGSQYGRSGVGGDRYGITGKIHFDWGIHSIEGGLWAERDKYHRTQLRLNLTGGSPDGDVLSDEVVYFRRDYRSERETLQLFLKDSISLLDNDRLVAEFGIKALKVDYQHRGYRDFNDYVRFVGGVALPGWGPQSNTASYSDMFLPMAGVVYRFDQRTQVFASYAENYALPKGLDDIYSVTFNSSSAVVPQPDPEKAQNFEIGVRTNQGQFYGALAGYLTKFDNRIQSFSTLLPGTGNVTETFFQNVGGVEAYGAEFTGTWRPTVLEGLIYFTGTATYNHAQFQDNIPGVALAGKSLPDSAKWLIGGSVTIEPAPWLIANVNGRYISSRYSSFTNLRPDPANPTGPQISSAVPGYTVFNAYVDIGEGIAIGPVKGIRARINIDNIFDKDTLSFISPSVATDGFFRPLAPRTIQGTISVEF